MPIPHIHNLMQAFPFLGLILIVLLIIGALVYKYNLHVTLQEKLKKSGTIGPRISQYKGNKEIPVTSGEKPRHRLWWLDTKKGDVMMSLGLDEVDIESYVKEAQRYLLQAIEDPCSLSANDLKEVGYVIVNRAWEDPTYSSVAAKLCKFITQKEQRQQSEGGDDGVSFQCSVAEACETLLEEWQQLRQQNTQYWLSFCRFLSELFQQTQDNNQTVATHSRNLFKALHALVRFPCVNNFNEADLLCCIFCECGKSLHAEQPIKMQGLVEALRDAFLDPDLDSQIREMILPLIELHASGWELSQNAKRYYFSM